MKTTKCRRKPDYKHFAEVFSIIAIIIFANRVHMLDGSIEPMWLGYLSLFSICGLSIIGIENIAKLIEELSSAIKASKRRNNIKCYCNGEEVK